MKIFEEQKGLAHFCLYSVTFMSPLFSSLYKYLTLHPSEPAFHFMKSSHRYASRHQPRSIVLRVLDIYQWAKSPKKDLRWRSLPLHRFVPYLYLNPSKKGNTTVGVRFILFVSGSESLQFKKFTFLVN